MLPSPGLFSLCRLGQNAPPCGFPHLCRGFDPSENELCTARSTCWRWPLVLAVLYGKGAKIADNLPTLSLFEGFFVGAHGRRNTLTDLPHEPGIASLRIGLTSEVRSFVHLFLAFVDVTSAVFSVSEPASHELHGVVGNQRVFLSGVGGRHRGWGGWIGGGLGCA